MSTDVNAPVYTTRRSPRFCYCCFPPYTLLNANMVETHRVYPFIEGSYRPQMDFTTSIKSIIYLHNQSLNIWTHLFGIILFSYAAICHFLDDDKQHLRSTFIDFSLSITFFTSCILMLSLSAIYHIFEPVNKTVYGITLSCDLLGTALSIMGSTIYGIWIVMRCLPIYRNVYIGVVLLSCSGMIIVATNTAWRNDLRIVIPTFGLGTASGLVPAFHFAALYGTENFQGETTLVCVFSALGVMIIGISIFIMRYPERKYIRTFDIIGSSHQWWHICVMLSPYILYQGLIQAIGICPDQS